MAAADELQVERRRVVAAPGGRMLADVTALHVHATIFLYTISLFDQKVIFVLFSIFLSNLIVEKHENLYRRYVSSNLLGIYHKLLGFIPNGPNLG